MSDSLWPMKSILFICLGNICRSPAAEGVFRKMAEQAGRSDEFTIDSAGTNGYHDGEQADRRMRAVAESRGYQLDSISRRIDHKDFGQFDLIVTMDDSNYRHINTLHPGIGAEVVRMCDYSEKFDITEVPDPYYGGEAGFHEVLDILEDACSNLLRSL